MTKGYTIEVINSAKRTSKFYHYNNEQEAKKDFYNMFGNCFAILTEWAQFEDGLGDYEIEIERHW